MLLTLHRCSIKKIDGSGFTCTGNDLKCSVSGNFGNFIAQKTDLECCEEKKNTFQISATLSSETQQLKEKNVPDTIMFVIAY